MWRCQLRIVTFFGLIQNDNYMEYKAQMEEEVNYLVFWGRVGRETVMKMPLYKRKMWIKMTIKNLKTLYNVKD